MSEIRRENDQLRKKQKFWSVERHHRASRSLNSTGTSLEEDQLGNFRHSSSSKQKCSEHQRCRHSDQTGAQGHILPQGQNSCHWL